MSERSEDSTRQLLADADALIGRKPAGKADQPPSTRSLIVDSEKLLRRRPRRRLGAFFWVTLLLLVVAVLTGAIINA